MREPLARTFEPEFFDVNPPVIPVKFKRPKGKGKPGTMSQLGFDGFALNKIGGKWRVTAEPNMTIKCLGDGYAEVPDTKNNRELLKTLSKPMKEKATYDRGVSVDKADPNKLLFKNNKGIVKILTKEALDEGEIRLIDAAHEVPATVEALKAIRNFETKDHENIQRVRPWLREFVKVNEAQMQAATI